MFGDILKRQSLTNKRFGQDASRASIVYKQDDMPTTPELGFLLTANKALQDSITRQWSFIDITNAFFMPKSLNFLYQTVHVGGRILNVPAGLNKTVVSIVDPEYKLVIAQELSGQLTQGDVDFAARFNLVKFEKLGRYHLKVIHNGVPLKDDDKFYFQVQKLL